MLCWLKGWQRVSRAPKGRWPHSQTRAAGVVRASPLSGGWLAAGPEASVPGSAAHARAPSVLRRGPLDREWPRRRERTGAEGGGRPARAALGAWGRRASPPFAGATAPARAGRAPRAYVRGPSRARAAWGTRGRRRRRASTPRAKAAASGRRGPDASQAPGGRGSPNVAPWGARVSRSPRRAVRAPPPGRPLPPDARPWRAGGGSPTSRRGGARARAGRGRCPRDAGLGDAVYAVGPRGSRRSGARERVAWVVLFSVSGGTRGGPPA